MKPFFLKVETRLETGSTVSGMMVSESVCEINITSTFLECLEGFEWLYLTSPHTLEVPLPSIL